MAGDQKFCQNCGTPHTREVLFCTSCGARFLESTESTPIPSATSSAALKKTNLTQTPNSDFITLSCPNCGGKLAITSDIERFSCQFCGYEHIVRRSEGIVSLEPVVQMMGQIANSFSHVGNFANTLNIGTEIQAAEFTIKRLKEEIAELQNQLNEIYDAIALPMGFGIFISVIFAPVLIILFFFWDNNPVFLITAGVCIAVGIAILAFRKNKKHKEKEIVLKQQIKQKETELQRNYDFLSRSK